MRGLVLEKFVDVEQSNDDKEGNTPGNPYTYKEDIPKPIVKPGLLLVRVEVAGFCHTELIAAAVSIL